MLRQGESGTSVSDVYRSIGISEATFYVWKKKCASLGMTELRKLRQLEAGNARLKRLVANLTLDKNILPEVIAKKLWGRHAAGRTLVGLSCCAARDGR